MFNYDIKYVNKKLRYFYLILLYRYFFELNKLINFLNKD